MAKELTITEKLKTVKAKVIDVQTDPANKRAVVSVELTMGTKKWHKPFGVSLEQGEIKWVDFVEEVKKSVKKDLDKDLAIAKIKAKENVSFNLF